MHLFQNFANLDYAGLRFFMSLRKAKNIPEFEERLVLHFDMHVGPYFFWIVKFGMSKQVFILICEENCLSFIVLHIYTKKVFLGKFQLDKCRTLSD